MKEEINILLIEDNRGDALLIQEALKETTFHKAKVLLGESIADAAAFKYDKVMLLLVDLGLPDSDGLETVRQIRKIFPDSALIVLTGLDDENIAVETLREGAQNYLNKNDINGDLLDRTIRYSLERHDILQKLKAADKELIQSKFFLEKAQEVAHMGSWVADLIANTADWSDETQRIFGFAPGEFDSQITTFSSMVHPDDLPELGKKLEAAFTEKKLFDITHRIIRKDGVTRWVHSQAEVIFDESGKPTNMIGSVQDITQMKEVEDKIIKANRLYSFISHINQAIVHIKDESILLEEACRIAVEQGKFAMAWVGLGEPGSGKLALAAQCAASTKDTQILSDFPYEEVSPFFKVMAGDPYYLIRNLATEPGLRWAEHSLSMGYRSVVILGIKRWGRRVGVFTIVSAEIDFFDSEEIQMLQEAAGDISFALEVFAKEVQREQAERRLVHSEASLKEAESIALIGSGEIDLLNDTVSWSDGLYELLNVDTIVPPSMELFFARIHEEDRDKVIANFEAIMQTRTATNFDFRIVRLDGEIRYATSEYKFELDADNKPIRLYGIVKDITHEKLAQEEKEKIISDIVQRNKDLEQFAYIVSHNLRLPVANIMGFADLLKSGVLDAAEEKTCMDSLFGSVMQLDDVVRDLNHVLQLKREINENREPFLFSDLVQKIKSSIQSIIQKEDAHIFTDFSAVDEVISLKSYMYSVFYNLISNSLKYRKANVSPVIEIKSMTKNNEVILSFKDSGAGMDLERNRDQIFGLYKRFHSHVEGKGMGLFMVKTQVESLGGKIEVHSKVNQGTEFIITFDKKAFET